ncbi:MAG TPA: DUF362 domain-containing protein [Paludibacter sp.]
MKTLKFMQSDRFSKILFFLFGAGSILWFLIRVIPKPSRATYPCMRATYPLMTAFVVYLVAMFSSMFLFKKNLAKYAMLLAFVVVAFFSFDNDFTSNIPTSLNSNSYYTNQANQPIGIAQGVFPGRVVWVHNPDVTNGEMKNTVGDYWYMDKNCNQVLVDSMLSSGVRRVGGKANVKQAWDNIFIYFNKNHGRGDIGYQEGEKIAIKINLTNSCCNNGVPNNLMDAAPQMVLAILHQLIDVVGVAQADVWIGDPYRIFRNEYYTKCHSVYSKVHYIDGTGNVGGRTGREVTVPSANQVMVFSDKSATASLPQQYLNATYLINMGCLKSHDCAGITICAKNHQGSILNTLNGDKPANQSAYYMHPSLPYLNTAVNQYRHLVDYMGHKDLGGKTLLYIVDGLWAGNNSNGYVEKWKTTPFNNDYPSSLFLSQDAVAIESVCFDFLLAEYANKPDVEKYPYMTGVDDYLKQAADPGLWPNGIVYDPEGDGTPIGSLGVYEHWNDSISKKYSRNLGTGNGIELKTYTSLLVDNYTNEITAVKGLKMVNYRIYPTPFTSNLHIETGVSGPVTMSVFNLQGQKLYNQNINKSFDWDGKNNMGVFLKKGNYILQLKELKSNRLIVNCKIYKE